MMMTTGKPSDTVAVSAAPEDYLDVGVLRRRYIDYRSSKREELDEQREARHYYHGDQWTDEQRKTLNKRKQPIVTYNAISRKIDGVVGLVERLRQDPKAFPRTPQHQEGSDIASASLRYALDTTDWPAISSECSRTAAINGLAGIEFDLEDGDNGDKEPRAYEVDPDTFWYDARSYKHDFSDARDMGVAKWTDVDVAKEMFPDRAEELDGLLSGSGDLDGSAQQDRERKWIDGDKKRLFIVEHWYLHKGRWCYCFYTSNVELKQGTSPFQDEKKRSVHKYEMFSAGVDHDGDRYGFVRNLKSAQDEKNHRRSKALHALNSRRIIARNGALANPEKTRQEAARPDGMILWDVEKPEFDDQRQMADMQGQMEFAKDASTEIENFGPNPALVGQGIEAKSGRAIQLLQQAGIAELGPFIIALKNWKMRVYRRMWNMIRQNWTAERWIRVTDNDGLAQFIQVNGLTGQDGIPQVINSLGSLDVDIILDEGPDNINAQQDALDILMQGLGQNGVPIPPKILVKLSQLPGDVKKEVLDEFEQAQQKPDPAAAAMEAKLQLEQAKMQMDAQAAQQKSMMEAQQAQEKAQLDAAIARQKAQEEIELKRMIALADIQLERERAAAQIEIEQMKASAGIAINRETAQAKAAQAVHQES
jgi:hypothetical protein